MKLSTLHRPNKSYEHSNFLLTVKIASWYILLVGHKI